ncbi:MAG: hypothetical protein VX346_02590 [Planctomycetota bacterium]|nr:hypothetical protein [Planctomycetota bacterium]
MRHRHHHLARLATLVGSFTLLLPAAAPSAPPGNGGTIRGQLVPADSAGKVLALHRASGKTFPGKVDPKTGSFSIGPLPFKGIYACRVDFATSRLEGINLKVPPSDYVEEQPLSAEDLATIKTKVRRMNKFEDVVEIKTISGNIQHAAILLNKLRTRPFFGSKPGEVVWRSELWHFERPEETWVKVQDELFVVLYRQRMQHADYRKQSVTFDAALGGIRLTRETPQYDLGRIERPRPQPGIHFRNGAADNRSQSKTAAPVTNN